MASTWIPSARIAAASFSALSSSPSQIGTIGVSVETSRKLKSAMRLTN
jgi:hypothetical protein